MTERGRLPCSVFAEMVNKGLARKNLPDFDYPPHWERDKSILKDFIDGRRLSFKEIGERHGGLSISATRTIAERTARLLIMTTGTYPYSLDEPALKLPKRPMTVEQRFAVSERMGGNLREVAEIAQSSPHEPTIKIILGKSSGQISDARRKLNRVGIKIPRDREIKTKNHAPQIILRTQESDGVLKTFMNSLTPTQYDKYRKEGVISSLVESIRSLGYRVPSAAIFTQLLDQIGFPYGRITKVVKSGPEAGPKNHLFIVTSHLPALEEALKAQGEAQKLYNLSKIEQISLHKGPVPKKADLKNRKVTVNVKDMFKAVGREIPKDLDFFFYDPKCHASVYKFQGFYTCMRRDAQKLVFFIINKLAERDRNL